MTPDQAKDILRKIIQIISFTALIAVSPFLLVLGLIAGAFGGLIGTVTFFMCLIAWAFSDSNSEARNWEELQGISWAPPVFVVSSGILLILSQFVPK